MTEPEHAAPGESRDQALGNSHQKTLSASDAEGRDAVRTEAPAGSRPDASSAESVKAADGSHSEATSAPHAEASGDPHPEAAGGQQPSALDTRRRRLLFRATHRGTFENDLMIGGFVRAHLISLTETDLDALEAVMQIQDNDLADWLTGRMPIPPEEETPMLRRMREFLTR